MEQTINKHPRIEVVDALRGFAVMAIILVHNLEHFIFPVYPTQSPSWLNILDQGIFNPNRSLDYYAQTNFLFVICLSVFRLQWNPIAPSKRRDI